MWGVCDVRGVMLQMQMRFDGTLGFPGGELEEGETPEEAASREVREVRRGREKGGMEGEREGVSCCYLCTVCA